MFKKTILQIALLTLSAVPHIETFDWITIDETTTRVDAHYSDGTVHSFLVNSTELKGEEKLTDRLLEQMIKKRKETWGE